MVETAHFTGLSGTMLNGMGTAVCTGECNFQGKRRRIMSELIAEINDADFESEVLQSEGPVLVDFSADWCPPCRLIAPALDAVAGEYAGAARIVKVNVDDNSITTQRYGIKGMPTLILFKNGREQERIVGAVSREVISRMVGKHLSATSV
jgi:thioredoxin 1